MSQKLVLVIEDDPGLAQAYVEIITIEGHQAELISDGRDALTRLSQTRPHLIILDMHLPHVSGMDILDYIVNEPRLSATKVVVMTADPEMAKQAEAHTDSVYFKPVNLTQITEILSLL